MKSEKIFPLPHWVPNGILNGYSEMGIIGLFEWQANLLNEGIDGNLVYSAPTSAGKSIVAELIALKMAISGRKIIFILPYISVAKEKLLFLQRLWRRADLEIAGFIGHQSASSHEWSAAVCTIEKANSLLNHALLDGNFHQIGLIIIDELHMVFDCSRGTTLEGICTKITYWNRKVLRDHEKIIRIIGMSTTTQNIHEIGNWINAKVIETSICPVELCEWIGCDGELLDMKSGKVVRQIDSRCQIGEKIDDTIGFSLEAVINGFLTLIFCSSKIEVEEVALEIAKILDSLYKSDEKLLSRLNKSALWKMKMKMEQTCALDPVLAKALPRGVGLHHGGLTIDEREYIEKYFKSGALLVLVATSTLLSGVNLPAERVIIKAQLHGPAALHRVSYKQMVGRAGRMGHVNRGESILVVRRCDLDLVVRMLHILPQSTTLTVRDPTKIVLECICSGLTVSCNDVRELILCLFHPSNRAIEDIISDLVKNSFITKDDGGYCADHLTPTQLGHAALASALPPDAALFVFSDLFQASKAIALDTELHMLYLVTPINCSVWQDCNWNHLHSLFVMLDFNAKRVAKMVGISDRFIMSKLCGKSIMANDRQYQLHLRFFSALALFDVVNENSISTVAKRFRISRGALQTLQLQSATYAAMVVSFCSRLGWVYLRDLLSGFATRLAFGVRKELSELVLIQGIDASRARVFHNHGITSLSQMACSTIGHISTILSYAVPFESLNRSDGRAEWLVASGQIRIEEAALQLIQRAGQLVKQRIREIGFDVDTNDSAKLQVDQSENDINFERMNCKSNTQPTSSSRAVTSNSEPIQLNITHSTDKSKIFGNVGIPKTNLLQLGETSIDLFTQSIDELLSGEVVTSDANNIKNSNGKNIILSEYDDEVDDLETSLLRVSLGKIANNEDNSSEKFSQVNLCKEFVEDLEDSFDHPISVTVSKTSVSSSNNFYIERLNSSCNTSYDLFDSSPTIHQKITKRTRQIMPNTPSIVSPLGKCSRLTAMPIKVSAISVPYFTINDVCRNETAWNHFVQRSSIWKLVGLSLAFSPLGTTVDGIVFCTPDSNPDFISLSQEYFPGNSCEESLCPSSTPSQSIPISDRLSTISHILSSCQVYMGNALKDSLTLWESFKIMVSRPVCISYLSFLSHIKCGDSVPTISQIATEFEWNFDVQAFLLMNPRIRTAVQAFIYSRLVQKLPTLVINMSSAKSFNLEFEIIKVINQMSLYGICFDSVLCATALSLIKTKVETLEIECYNLVGKSFNLDSSAQVSEVLFCRLNLPYPDGMAITKRYLSTGKNILEQMIELHPIVEKILQYRKLKHVIVHCLLPLTACASCENTIRTSFDICSSTGRILSHHPNIQNIPKNEPIEGFSVRNLFTARKGHVLIAADYCQLELRVLAHLSGDTTLLSLFTDNDCDIFGDLSHKWKLPRDIVKQLCYGIIYGMGSKSLAKCIGVSVEEAERLISNFFSSFPKVKSYINNLKDSADEKGYVSTMLGRRRISTLRGQQEERARDVRRSVNYVIQGTASEIFKKALINIGQIVQGLPIHIVMVIHDEIIIECPLDQVNHAYLILRSCMQNVFHELLVPLRVKITLGPNWGSLAE